MNCLKLCSPYQAINNSTSELRGIDAENSPFPLRSSTAEKTATGHASSSENREIEEVVQQICDIAQAADGRDNEGDIDAVGLEGYGSVYTYCPRCHIKASRNISTVHMSN
jgi:hypothetical protein